MTRIYSIFFLILTGFTYAQNEEIDLEQFSERLFQVQDENIPYEDIYESLLLFYSNKLNLNSASSDELSALYILNPRQINNLFDYKDQFGKLLSINELQVISGFDAETIRSLRPFITITESVNDPSSFLKKIFQEENNYLLLRYTRTLEQQRGYTTVLPLDTLFIRNENGIIVDTSTALPPRYRGSPDKIYGRFRASHKDDFSIGFTFEKDAGEKIEFNNSQKGFDFYSCHLLLENTLGFDKIILGDYQLQAGQGIVFVAGFATGKGAETVNTIKRNSLGLKPYTSVLESGFFRGFGLTKAINHLDVTLLYSQLKLDGSLQQGNNISIDPSFLDEEEFINSIQNTGFHRTERELFSKDKLTEESAGIIVEYKPNRKFSVGVTGLHTSYSIPLQRRPNNYNLFEFKGDHNYVTSTYLNYTWQNFMFFGEVARSKSGGTGAISGLMTSLSPIVDMGVILRNYDRDFHSFHGNSFSENSRNINEKGVYWSLQIKPNSKHQASIFFDQFKFPWLKFGTESPSVGHEYLMRYTHSPSREISMYLQMRQQSKQVSSANENLNVLEEQIKRNYIFNINYALKSGLTLKTKIQSSTQNEGSVFTKGFAIIQDVNFDLWKIKFHTRMALFDTDNFDNAQYAYENDVLYAFSIPAYNGTGVKSYAMLRYDPTRNIAFWIRYARTEFRNTNALATTESSLNLIQGNVSSEIKAMIRVKF